MTRLFRITAIVEAQDEHDAEAVHDDIIRAICPHPGGTEHPCPRGWMTCSTSWTPTRLPRGWSLTP